MSRKTNTDPTGYTLTSGRLTVSSPMLGGVTITYAEGETVPPHVYDHVTEPERKRLKAVKSEPAAPSSDS